MEKLYELHDETDFDLVVVDTPPTRHALDFLDAPRRLSRFLDHRLFRLLIAPSRGIVKAVNVAAQTFLRTVSRVVGGDVVDDAVAFFQAFEGMEEGFRQRAARVNELLAADGTAFVLVASPRRDTVEEAHFFAERLGEAGIAVRGLVVNRVHPASGSGDRARGPDGGRHRRVGGRAARRAETLAGTAIGGLYRNLADFQAGRRPGARPPGRAGRGGGAGPGGVGAVPAQRRARPRRAGRDGRPRLPRVTLASTGAGRPVTGAWRSDCVVERGGGLVEGGDRRLDGLGDRHDAVEAGGVEQAREGGPAAGHGHVAAGLAGPADAADQRPEARRVHERHRRQVDEQVALVGQLAERIAELPDGVGVELADGPADGVAVGLVDLDVEHASPPGTRRAIVAAAVRSGSP